MLEIRLWVKDLTSLKELLTTTGTGDFVCVSENGVNAGLSLIFQVDGELKKVAGGQKKSGERGGGLKV